MTLIWIVLALFVGWNMPQPAWAKVLQEKVVSAVKGWINRED